MQSRNYETAVSTIGRTARLDIRSHCISIGSLGLTMHDQDEAKTLSRRIEARTISYANAVATNTSM